MSGEEDDPVAQAAKNGFQQLELFHGLHQNLGIWPSGEIFLDQEGGVLSFVDLNGREVTAPIQIVGTINNRDGTWLWAWANPFVFEPLKQTALHVRAFGEKHRNAVLTTATFPCTFTKAWELVSIAFHLSEGFDAYPLPGDEGWTFVILEKVPKAKGG